MKLQGTTRSKLPCYTFGFLGLAVLVFTWGLQYKLSLYSAPHSIARHMVQAKLLANDEHTRVPVPAYISDFSHPDGGVVTFHSGALFLPLLGFSILLAASQRSKEVCTSEQPWRAASQASFNAFFFRPPPALS